MATLAKAFVLIVALEHVWFLVLEMFLWTKPIGLKTFRQSETQAKATATLAANQGLYNGFLAAGLVWGAVSSAFPVEVFFLCCVVVAGAFGAATVSKRILLVQGAPAALALLLLVLSRG